MVLRSTSVSVTFTYCPTQVITCGSGCHINNFILTGELNTQINDLNTGCPGSSYDDRTSQMVTLYANTVYRPLISTSYGSSMSVAIWIDFNDDFQFQLSERVALHALVGTSDNLVNMTIPAISSTVLVGIHRMRVALSWASTPDPCITASSGWGETHDYRVNLRPTGKLDN